MKGKAEKDLDIGALLIGMDEPDIEDGEDDGEDASHEDVAAAAMEEFKTALKGDDTSAQVSAFRTLMDACRMYDKE